MFWLGVEEHSGVCRAVGGYGDDVTVAAALAASTKGTELSHDV